MTDPADVYDLRWLAERAVPLATPSTSHGQHPLGIGIPRGKVYSLGEGGGIVPLPNRPDGLVELRGTLAADVLGLSASDGDAAWSGLLGNPSMVVPLVMPSIEALLAEGVVVPVGASLQRFRRIGLAAVLAPQGEQLDEGYLPVSRFAGAATLTVQLAKGRTKHADNAWLQVQWCSSVNTFSHALEALYEGSTAKTRKASASRATILVVTKERDEIVSVDLESSLTVAAAVRGLDLKIIRLALTSRGNLDQILKSHRPRFALALGPEISLRRKLEEQASQSEFEYRIVDSLGSRGVDSVCRDALDQIVGVSASLHVFGRPLRTPKWLRPAIPVKEPGECLHHRRLQRVYVEDRSDNSWWTRDDTTHADSVFKSYRRKNGKLEHQADHAADGRIIPKWKGREGKTIFVSDLDGCSAGGPHLV